MTKKHTYMPYDIKQMMADSRIEQRLKDRIMHLVNNYVISIQAAHPNNGGTFVAYSGNVALTYNAYLFIKIFGDRGGCGMTIAFDKKPADYGETIVKTLKQYSYMTKGR